MGDTRGRAPNKPRFSRCFFGTPFLTHSKTTTISKVNWSRRDWSLKCTPNFFQTRTTGPFHRNLSELGSLLWITEKTVLHIWTSSSNWRPAKRCKTLRLGFGIYSPKSVFFFEERSQPSKSEVEAMHNIFMIMNIWPFYGHLSEFTHPIKAILYPHQTQKGGVCFCLGP